MALVQRLDIRQGQALVMTPQLQQAIKLLQLSNLELSAYVEGEVEQNPLLERDDPSPDAPEPAAAEAAAPEVPASDQASPEETAETWNEIAGSDGDGTSDYAGDPDSWQTRNTRSDSDDLPSIDQTLARAVTLREHLLAQLAEEIKDPVDRVIGAHLVDQLDESGYVTVTLESVAETMGCEVAKVEHVLHQLQRFEPTGVFARDLAECLALQLKERDRYDPAMQALIENLSLLACRDIPALLRLCRVDAADLAEMAAEIRALDPKPGLQFDGAIAH